MAEGFVREGEKEGQPGKQDQHFRGSSDFPLYVPTGLRYYSGPHQDEDVYYGSVPPGPRKQRRNTRRGRGPSPLLRYGGRTAPIPDSFVINATCSSARPQYPSYMFEFFLDYPTLSGTRLCHYGKSFVQNGVFLRALRARVGGHSCFPQALCKKDNNFCEAMEEEGLDSEGNRYATRKDLWLVETGTDHMKQRWYQKGVNYWSVRSFANRSSAVGWNSVSAVGRVCDVLWSLWLFSVCLYMCFVSLRLCCRVGAGLIPSWHGCRALVLVFLRRLLSVVCWFDPVFSSMRVFALVLLPSSGSMSSFRSQELF